MTPYRYLRGSCDSRESVEYDISRRGQYITTCAVDVDRFLCGIRTFPCGNGDDIKLTVWQQIDILELVLDARTKITSGIEIKTMESWNRSGLNFEDYCFPGDVVGKDIVNYFVNVVPPTLTLSFCTQAGEEHSIELDEKGVYHPTFLTFHHIGEDRWQFDGFCFYKENQNRVEKTYSQQRIERLIAEISKEVKAHGNSIKRYEEG